MLKSSKYLFTQTFEFSKMYSLEHILIDSYEITTSNCISFDHVVILLEIQYTSTILGNCKLTQKNPGSFLFFLLGRIIAPDATS